jgi:hypothetical protein
MKLRPDAVMVLDSLVRFPVGADTKNIQEATVHRNAPPGAKRYWTARRTFSILDRLQTAGLVERIKLWPAAGDGIVWILTQKGTQCLTEAHHH